MDRVTSEDLLSFLMEEGCLWVISQREASRPKARFLSDGERSGLSPFFEDEILDVAKVAVVPVIQNPPFISMLREAGLQHTLDFSTASGMTFCDTIVVSQQHRPAGSHWMSLLFHELVHVVQYEILGLKGFVERYVTGWAKNGYDYSSIPLERDAYELQERHDAAPGQPFSVAQEVRRRLFD